MAKAPLFRPVMQKPDVASGEGHTWLTNVKVNPNRTTGESPKTLRMTPAEKVMCSELADKVQSMTTRTITDSTVIRAALYLAYKAGPEKILKIIEGNM